MEPFTRLPGESEQQARERMRLQRRTESPGGVLPEEGASYLEYLSQETAHRLQNKK